MKKLTLATILALSTLTAVAHAEGHGGFQDPAQPTMNQEQFKKEHGKHRHGGFVNADLPVSKAADASQWKDEQWIVLEGNIVQQVGKDDYSFKDESGEITLEIKRRAFEGQTITPKERIKVYGEVEKSWNKMEVEVKHIEIIK